VNLENRYADLYEHRLWPLWEEGVRGRDTVDHLGLLQRSQWWSPEAIEAYQVAALRRLLRYAGDHVPYYRDLFRRIGFDPRSVKRREDVDVLPVLTREIVRERYEDLVAPAFRGTNVKKGTSGSTGTPLKFEYSPESESWRQATRVRGYGWAGYHPGLPTFYYWAVVREPPTWQKRYKLAFDRALKRETFFDSMKQDEASRRRALELLCRTKPHVIVAYVQSCAQFARWITDNGLRDWPDTPVVCGAEPVLPGDRAALERAFGPGIFETYGSRETMLLAAECEAHDGMHLSEENLLVQAVEDGRSVAPGQTGEVVVTDLHNYGMPFIRYLNGDLAVLGDGKACACGRGLRKLARVEGRRADTMRDREGHPIPGIIFHVLFSDARREVIRQFRATQKKSGDVVLQVVCGQDWSKEEFESTVRRFGEYLRGLPFTVEFTGDIPPAANGKMKTIVVER
jgi:phenylacetate-coenzyme A ligase PaaK-like adenylate-forming protein